MMQPAAGMLNIYKPSGVTSYFIVRQVKQALGIKKVGHCGTLDPLAEGVLLILFGAATKYQSTLMGQTKVYRAKLRLGVRTDSGDVTGTVIEERDSSAVTLPSVEEVLPRFTGEIEQVPPMFSALKQNGQRLYDLARQGITVDRAPRKVTIYSIDLLGFSCGVLELRVSCSRGTYIRTLAEDIGAALGCGATIEYLCRERVGTYGIESSIDGAGLRQMAREALLGRSYPVEHLQGLSA